MSALTRETWLELAQVIRDAPGYEVVESLGERPGGPPQTRWTTQGINSARRNPARNVKRIPPTIRVKCPDGRVRNVGSIDRWNRIRWGNGERNGQDQG